MANLEPWRMALAYLYQYIGHDLCEHDLPFMNSVPQEKKAIIKAALENKINSPLTSSAGRLFDAVAALTGICTVSSFHAEAPMRLENLIDPEETGQYEFLIDKTIDPKRIIQCIVDDIKSNLKTSSISTKFHRSIVSVIHKLAIQYRDQTGINKVVLSGGSFQNKFLLAETEKSLTDQKFMVFTQSQFPSNDGGIALGQLVIAAKRREIGLNKYFDEIFHT
jgi:hydrogenase maturation protein HypF